MSGTSPRGRIPERREEYLGTYSIVWFDAYSGEQLVESFNALGVEAIVYAAETRDDNT